MRRLARGIVWLLVVAALALALNPLLHPTPDKPSTKERQREWIEAKVDRACQTSALVRSVFVRCD